MPEIQNEVLIDAPADQVLALAMKVEAFPDFMPEVKRVTVQERDQNGHPCLVAWEALIPEFALTMKWTERDQWDTAKRTCVFTQAEGQFSVYEGQWCFEDVDGRTRFLSTLRYEIDIPMVGPLIKGLIRKKMWENVDPLQQALKARAEEAACGSGAAA